MNAKAAKSAEARHSHTLLAAGYARQINQLGRPQREDKLPLVPLT